MDFRKKSGRKKEYEQEHFGITARQRKAKNTHGQKFTLFTNLKEKAIYIS